MVSAITQTTISGYSISPAYVKTSGNTTLSSAPLSSSDTDEEAQITNVSYASALVNTNPDTSEINSVAWKSPTEGKTTARLTTNEIIALVEIYNGGGDYTGQDGLTRLAQALEDKGITAVDVSEDGKSLIFDAERKITIDTGSKKNWLKKLVKAKAVKKIYKNATKDS